MSGERYLKVTSRTYVMPESMSPVMLEHLGNTLANLANTLQFNMGDPDSPKRLERSVFADNGIEPEDMGEFERYARERVQQLIVDIDDWLASNGKKRPQSPDAVATGLSIFHYVNAVPQQKSLKDLID